MIRNKIALLDLAKSDDGRVQLCLRWIDESVEYIIFNGDESPIGFRTYKEAYERFLQLIPESEADTKPA